VTSVRSSGTGAGRWAKRRSAWIAASCLLVLIGSIGSLLGAEAVRRGDTDRDRLAFHIAAANITSALQLDLQHEEDLVISASAFVTGSSRVTPDGFDRWVESVRAMSRYPELENIGLVVPVAAAQLPAFQRRLEASPVEPLGAGRGRPDVPFSLLPEGKRPYYCLAVAGLARDMHAYLPAGLDYCALAGALEGARLTGQTSYAPFTVGKTLSLGVQTPVYRGGLVPGTEAARRSRFVGWLGELIQPRELLTTALSGHAHTAVTFRYGSGTSRIVFSSGAHPAHAMAATIQLHNGWTVSTYGPAPPSGVTSDSEALMILIGGIVVSVLLGVLVLLLGTGRMRALRLVEDKTRELSHQALHDALTGLPNRALVMDRATQMLARSSRRQDAVAGALFLDVDGFKHINDTLGHAAGDTLLKVVAQRLGEVVRDQDTVGRLGGDEFVVLVESDMHETTAKSLADRLVLALREPIEIQPGRPPVSVTASIGVAVGRYASSDALLRDADLALYAAKAAGRDRYWLFDESMQDDAEERVALELDLRGAIEGKQLFLLYQPIFDLAGDRIVGVEALLRWRHPIRGVLAPGEFVPLAEETGLIVPIDRWVLGEACRQARAWTLAGRDVGVSVNVSAIQLGREDFADEVREALHRSGLEPSSLLLEITETTVMRDVQAASKRLEEVKRLGVSIAIDDFGTGYASLAHLQQLPADTLKVDGSFVTALREDDRSSDLLQAILGVGRSLSLRVIAEGIETEEQLQAVRDMGCEMGQGYLLSRPKPAESIGLLLGLGEARLPIG
jgi:diguanylate cyclase (GGDEF)-like protein